jgi:hypothetical protein
MSSNSLVVSCILLIQYTFDHTNFTVYIFVSQVVEYEDERMLHSGDVIKQHRHRVEQQKKATLIRAA